MDAIETFLWALHDKVPAQFQPVAEGAINSYTGVGSLSPKQLQWALNTAKFQRVRVPAEFRDLDAAPAQSAPAPAVDTPTILADALLAAASALITAAEALKGRE